MSFGQTLRESREAKGLSQSELASKTNLLVQVVNGLENEDFRMIPAPIYGRGFVKLYCEATGIDHKPLQEEFMLLYRKAREQPPKIEVPPPAKKEPVRPENNPTDITSEKPDGEPTSETISEPPVEKISSADSADAELPSAAEDLFTVTSQEIPPRKDYGELFGHSYNKEAAKPSAAEKFRDTMSNVSSGVFSNVKRLPPNIGRMIIVAVATVAVLAAIGIGISALYKATTPAKEEMRADEAENADTVPNGTPAATPKNKPRKTEQKETGAAKTKATAVDAKTLKSTGPAVPSLYIN